MSWNAVSTGIKMARFDHAKAIGVSDGTLMKMKDTEPTNQEIGDILIRLIKNMSADRLEREFKELMCRAGMEYWCL